MSSPTTPQTSISTWTIDPAHSLAEFKVKHMMISNVKGQFTGVSGTLERHEGDVTQAKVELMIDAASANTREAQRDAHLKSADFFEVQKSPHTFVQINAHNSGEPGRACSLKVN